MLCRNSSDIAIINFKGVDYRVLFKTLSNLLPFISRKILRLKIVGIYKMHTKEIKINNRVSNYDFGNLMKAKELKAINDLIYEKNYEDLVIYCSQ